MNQRSPFYGSAKFLESWRIILLKPFHVNNLNEHFARGIEERVDCFLICALSRCAMEIFLPAIPTKPALYLQLFILQLFTGWYFR